MADDSDVPREVQNSVSISSQARRNYGDAYDIIYSTRSEQLKALEELDLQLGRLKRLHHQLDDDMNELRSIFSLQTARNLGTDECQDIKELLVSCDVLNISIASRSDYISRKSRWALKSFGECLISRLTLFQPIWNAIQLTAPC